MPHTFFCSQDLYESSDIVLLGIPFDATSSFRPGSRFAPDHIRMYSEGIESYSPYQEIDLREIAFYDAGNLEGPINNFSVLRTIIHTQVKEFLTQGKKVFALGGEHLISLPVVEAYTSVYPDLHIIHFDAHADLRDEYLGESYSHATVMRRIYELIEGKRIYQFGIRSGLRQEFEFASQFLHFQPFCLNAEVLRRVAEALIDKAVYVTVDLDVLDPSYFPGTGTPEPGGATFHELLQALFTLEEVNIVGADIVELCPPYDHSDASTMTAIKLIREMLLLMGRSKIE